MKFGFESDEIGSWRVIFAASIKVKRESCFDNNCSVLCLTHYPRTEC